MDKCSASIKMWWTCCMSNIVLPTFAMSKFEILLSGFSGVGFFQNGNVTSNIECVSMDKM